MITQFLHDWDFYHCTDKFKVFSHFLAMAKVDLWCICAWEKQTNEKNTWLILNVIKVLFPLIFEMVIFLTGMWLQFWVPPMSPTNVEIYRCKDTYLIFWSSSLTAWTTLHLLKSETQRKVSTPGQCDLVSFSCSSLNFLSFPCCTATFLWFNFESCEKHVTHKINT